MAAPPPWDIYKQELGTRGYGHPLWHPDSSSGDINIGTVGWIRDGQFHTLLDTTKNDGGTTAIPEGFVQLEISKIRIVPSNEIMQDVVSSQSIRTIDAGMGGTVPTTVAPGAPGANFRYQTTRDTGAFVKLKPPGVQRLAHSTKIFKNYMNKHFESWLTLANSDEPQFGLELSADDLLFVCGTIKTEQWTVVSFHGRAYSGKEFTLSADGGPVGAVNVTVRIENEVLPASHVRNGPYPPIEQLEPTQCIFLHYYKMRRRWSWPFGKEPMKAAAGPHHLPRNPGDPSACAGPVAAQEDLTYEIEGTQVPSGFRDPVDVLLDYILENAPEAECAIASDLDLYACFPVMFLQTYAKDLGVVEGFYGAPDKRKADEEEKAESLSEPDPKRFRPEHSVEPEDDSPYLSKGSRPDVDPTTKDDDGDTGGSKMKRRDTTTTHEGSVTTLTYSPDSTMVATGSDDFKIIIWSVSEGRSFRVLEQHEEPISALAFSSDNGILASASLAGDLLLTNIKNPTDSQSLEISSPVQSLAFTPNANLLLAGTSNREIQVWDLSENPPTSLPPLKQDTHAVTFIIFSPDGTKMVTGGIERDVVLWETSALRNGGTGKIVSDRRVVYSAAFAHDGARLVTSYDDGSLTIWNAVTAEALVRVKVHTSPVWAVAFSPDGRLVATGGDDGAVKLFNSLTGQPVREMREHGGPVNNVAFAPPDGRYVASAASDKIVRLWNTETGALERNFNEHNDDVTQMKFSPDGSTLASGSLDGEVYIRRVLNA
ncbi:WD40-repeat-containing domain protein [Epithele typhae]|uniref:WD40-repeat-containing domain protein n=1 Tax=Epithele typhae TaxID=378194 RepID=UPI0020073D2D|nr:WD40-repeat-containing domain protein [Epithele typhae]KAH9923765.1 WD40-repeat-containing domain protein [Epithele typhae]